MSLRILYIGPLNPWGTCLSRMRGLIEFGMQVIPFDVEIYLNKKKGSILDRLPIPIRNKNTEFKQLNEALLDKVFLTVPDIIWVDKGYYLWPNTLMEIKKRHKSLILHHCTDDIMRQEHIMNNYFDSLIHYDAHYTSNKFNIDELKSMTDSHIGYNEIGYDHHFIKNLKISQTGSQWKSDLFFIGHWEPNTEKYIKAIVDENLPINVRGPGWYQSILNSDVIKSEWFYGPQYVEAINAGKIGLGFVSKWNRNETAGRCFEIPACGTMLLAVRTNILQDLYKEGKEAEFFSDPQELMDKAKFYLNNPDERKKIAKAGMERCILNKCSWKDRVGEILSDLSLRGLI